MSKEILLYSSIYSFTAESFLEKMEAAKGEDIVLRLNTPGGDVQAGYGMIAKFAEHEGKKLIKVDGKANSMGAFFLAFADNVEALDVSEIVLHRAAYPSYFEARDSFKGSEEYKAVVKMNKDLRSKLEAKIDTELFEKLTKVSMDKMFSMDSRIDVSITPAQAKRVGLISKVNKLTSEMSTEIQANTVSIAAEFGVDVKELEVIKADILPVIEDKPKINKKMTIEDLKANHPSVYNQIFTKGSEAGVAERNDTIGAWLSYADVDVKAVTDGIKSGEKLSQTAQAEFGVKMFSAAALTKETNGTAEIVTPVATTSNEPVVENAEALAELDNILNIKS
jgi:ATP-dependent protease ClpP protease subunit